MGTIGNPKVWVPYINPKDCTQGFCSLSCPQWCYIIFPPPPPSAFLDDKSQSKYPNFSPLVIAIIGILASAFLLVSYYAIISKYCGNSEASTSRRGVNQPPNEELEEDNHNEPPQHEAWLICTPGLDEALIKAITLVKYKKGSGLFGSTTDCSVCLGEFLEDESLRLLPKCSHAFHVPCIDTWLQSHSNCPLCRANIVSSFVPPLNINHNNNHPPRDHESSSRNEVVNEEVRSREERRGGEHTSGNIPKCPPVRALSDLGGVIGVGDHEGRGHLMRRSISMDHSNETRVSIADIVRFDQRGDCQVGNSQLHDDQSLKEAAGESSKSSICNGSSSNSRNGVLNSLMNSVAMKRSFSSGRFLFSSKHGRVSHAVLPV